MECSNHNVLVWNVRGLNNLRCVAVIKSVVDEANASVVCFVESKLGTVDQFSMSRILGNKYDAFVALPANNSDGRIVVVWQSAFVTVGATRVDVFSVTVEFGMLDAPARHLMVVYGTIADQLKVPFLQELGDVRAACPGLWAVTGDFNLIVEAADKNNDIVKPKDDGPI